MLDRPSPRKRTISLSLLIVFCLSALSFPIFRYGTVADAQTDSTLSTVPAAMRIDAERLTGRLDYATSLLYRAYALTGDERLPARFTTYTPYEDQALWREIREIAPSLPIAERLSLESYLLRPTDPRSPFFDSQREQSGIEQVPTVSGSIHVCTETWGSRKSVLHPGKLKVWAHCDEHFAADTAKVLTLFEGLWTPMTDLMGEPIADRGTADAGGDTALDLYLLSHDETIRRGGATKPAPFDTYGSLAYAVETAPFIDVAASGYIIMDRAVLDLSDLRGTLAHEFFHVLQYAHNYELALRQTDQTDMTGNPIWQSNWIYEATANWAHTRFVPETASEAIHSVSFAQCFQWLDISLHFSRTTMATDSDESCHAYGSYIWFYFVEQELGSATFMKTIWNDLATTSDWDDTITIVDERLPFREHFRAFAVRNLNLDLQPGSAISPRYQDADPTFPFAGPIFRNTRAAQKIDIASNDARSRTFASAISPLAAHYYRFTSKPNVQSVTFNVSGFEPIASMDVDLIIGSSKTGWNRRNGDSPSICIDLSGTDSTTIYLILSNHDLNETMDGEFTVHASAFVC